MDKDCDHVYRTDKSLDFFLIESQRAEVFSEVKVEGKIASHASCHWEGRRELTLVEKDETGDVRFVHVGQGLGE